MLYIYTKKMLFNIYWTNSIVFRFIIKLLCILGGEMILFLLGYINFKLFIYIHDICLPVSVFSGLFQLLVLGWFNIAGIIILPIYIITGKIPDC